MNSLRLFLPRTLLAIGCLLVVAAANPALANPHAFSFWQGPAEMVIPMNEFRQFHSHLTNTGTAADSYTMTVTREQPESWLFNVCYQGVCWPEDQVSFQIPTSGVLESGEVMDFEFDVTSLFAEGEALYTVHLVSNNDSSQQRTLQYAAWSPTEPSDMLLAVGETIIFTDVNTFVRFEPMLYNAGTEPDSYTLTMTRDLPAYWFATFCFDGICYPDDQEVANIPDGPGLVPGGGVVPLEIDFTTLFDEGTGSVTLTIVSNSNPLLTATVDLYVTTDGVVSVEPVVPTMLSGLHAAPNPFNPRTEIRFDLGGQTPRDVVIDIHDATGRRVRSLHAGNLQPGRHHLAWDGLTQGGQPAAAGVYLARVQLGQVQQTVKLSLVK